ncbi:MAG: trypsin-like serine protease [Bacteroidia bacterium]|nr:trypsin-like serine protease [Bacteroidia bacterium]
MEKSHIKNYQFYFLLIIVFGSLTSGIGRHDINQDKYSKLAQQKQFDCVGKVYIDNELAGSCVLICESTVLSAAHVFVQSETRPDTLNFNGQKAVVFIPFNNHIVAENQIVIEINGEKRKVKRLTVHQNYADSIDRGICDFALLELEQPIRGVKPALLNQHDDELHSEVTGVGFGAGGVADKPENNSDSKSEKRAGENVIDSVGGELYNGKSTLMFCDFDHPTRNDCNKMGSAKPQALEYICSGGDSGGGLFRKRKGEWELIGICSGAGVDMAQFNKSGYYGQTMQWTRVSVFKEWINQNINID